MREVAALAMKDLRLQRRDRLGFFFTFIFPLIFAIFFGTIFSGGGSSAIGIVVVDLDKSEVSARFIRDLGDGDELSVREMEERAAAEELVRKGGRTAVVVIPRGFGEADLFSGQSAKVILGVDPARRAEAGMLEGLLTQRLFMRMQDAFSDGDAMRDQARRSMQSLAASPDASPEVKSALLPFLESVDTLGAQLDTLGGDGGGGPGWRPFEIEHADLVQEREGPTNFFAVSFPQAILWAIIACAASFAISMVTERTRGTLIRLRVSPISRAQILTGKALACFLTIIAATCLLLAIAHLPPFNVRIQSLSLLAIAVPSIAAAFVGIMLALSAVARTEASASGTGWAVLMVMSMIGGGMIPLFVMPGWMRTLSSVSPVKWSILALEGAIWRPFGMADMALPCGILLCVGAVGFALGWAGSARGESA